ncbi:uncharacterized protein Dwil_GK11083 [Drosophila willistoni]|uniref:Tubulin-specific chaperone A n=1 Tax=Drosophila willistoni TaxID=7260 RepID=B4N883_DROWI|nr:uncharacterized protein LOC124459781 [Drosophila willistoni]EDW81334.1 uncharacterized protein Dwil_GK11083 [Drosophila willistoni]
MEDPRKRLLRNIIDNVYHLDKRRFFQQRQIQTETERLERYIADVAMNHKKYEQLQKIEGSQSIFDQVQRQLQLECEKLEKFLKFNDDLKTTDCYVEAKQLLEAARSEDKETEKEHGELISSN